MPSIHRSKRVVSLLGLVFVALSSCRVTDAPLWGPGTPSRDAYPVECLRGIVYQEGPGKTDNRHQLDLYLPRGVKDFPVVVFVHGGAWMSGDNRCCGLHSSVAEFLAGQGFGVAVPNYRLSPKVKHPAHVQDVARAFAWTHSHIAEHGGRREQMYLLGHSAGGHLVSLLATDERYLTAEGLRQEDVKGVIAISGVYRIPQGKMKVTLDGEEKESFRLDQVLPIRQPSRHGRLGPALTPGLSIELNVFAPAFGDDPLIRANASPIHHVRPGLPPFLLLSAENDLPSLSGMAKEFHRALCDRGCDSRLERMRDRNHNSILFQMIDVDDPAATLVLEFLQRAKESR